MHCWVNLFLRKRELDYNYDCIQRIIEVAVLLQHDLNLLMQLMMTPQYNVTPRQAIYRIWPNSVYISREISSSLTLPFNIFVQVIFTANKSPTTFSERSQNVKSRTNSLIQDKFLD